LTTDGQIVAGSGDNQIFFHLAKNVQADGKMTDVEIGGAVTGSLEADFANPSIVAQLRSRYQAGATCQLVDILFPPGANYIVYDPTMGAGESPFSAPAGSGSNLLLIVLLPSIGGVIIIAAVVGLVIFFKRRSEYATIH